MDLGDSIGVTACRVSRSHVYWSDSTYVWALCILEWLHSIVKHYMYRDDCTIIWAIVLGGLCSI